MPSLFSSADPARLGQAIAAARQHHVDSALIRKAEAVLERSDLATALQRAERAEADQQQALAAQVRAEAQRDEAEQARQQAEAQQQQERQARQRAQAQQQQEEQARRSAEAEAAALRMRLQEIEAQQQQERQARQQEQQARQRAEAQSLVQRFGIVDKLEELGSPYDDRVGALQPRTIAIATAVAGVILAYCFYENYLALQPRETSGEGGAVVSGLRDEVGAA